MNKIVRKIILVIAIFIFIYSGYKFISAFYETKAVNEEVKRVQEIDIIETTNNENTKVVEIEPEEESSPYWDYLMEKLIEVDLTDLKKTNNDTKGWLQVKGTNINYPIVQTSDNDYYLNHSFEKKATKAGWVFLDYRNNIERRNKNIIIYAHGRKDGTMFGTLKNSLTTEWFNDETNHLIKMSTDNENTLWQVFSVYKIKATTDYLKVDFSSNHEYQNFLNMISKRSVHKFNVQLSEKDEIITLSTCYDTEIRIVMHARLIKKETKN